MYICYNDYDITIVLSLHVHAVATEIKMLVIKCCLKLQLKAIFLMLDTYVHTYPSIASEFINVKPQYSGSKKERQYLGFNNPMK